MSTESRAFKVILENEKGGGFSAYCVALPGCVSQGDDGAEVIRNIKEAISLVMDVLDDGVVGRDVAVRKNENPKSPPLPGDSRLDWRGDQGNPCGPRKGRTSSGRRVH